MEWDFIIRLCVAGLCGTVIGLDREYRVKDAGFRTHFLVALGSALIMIVSQYGFADILMHTGVGLDPSRIAAQVVSGIGFIGAGTIIIHRQLVRGLTTAAGLWAVAIIGTAFGAGFYAGGIICYAFIFLAMQVLRRVDLRIRKTQRVSTVYFEMEKKSTVGQIIRQVKGHGHYIWDLNLFSETQEKSGGPVCGTFTLWVNGKTTLDEEIQALDCLLYTSPSPRDS